jgi:MFS family permease
MVFFQVLLLAGYAYSDWITRKLSPRAQTLLHVALLLLCLALMPIIADPGWKPSGEEDPVWRILALLGATIGLPYFLLSSTGPLIQACFARRFGGEHVYRLFALSNFGSLLALLAFPFVIETTISNHDQAIGWSVGFALFALLCAASVHLSANASGTDNASIATNEAGPPPSLARHALWLTLAALGTIFLLSRKILRLFRCFGLRRLRSIY